MKSSASSSSLRWLVAALALAWTTSTSDAVTIDASSVAAPSRGLGNLQTLEKTWSVSGSASGLRSLLVATPASVFVDYDPSIRANSPGVVAKVVVTGDSEDLINALDVVSWSKNKNGDGADNDDGIELRFHSNKREFRGHLLTTILVGNKQALRTIKTIMSGDVVVTDDVLAVDDATAQLELSTFSSGDVRVFSTQRLTVKSLALSSFASGDVEIQAPSVGAVSDISITAFASGDVAVVAEKIVTELVSTKTGASGDVYVQADDLAATTLDTLVGGSGDVTLSRNGKCVNQTARVTRSGDYLAGSIVCEFADIGVFASGDALVQVTDQLVATIMGSGDIKYVNTPPKEVVAYGRSSHRGHKSSRKPAVAQASQNHFATFSPSEVPDRSPEFIVSGHMTQRTSNLAGVVPSSMRASTTVPVVIGLVGVVMGVAGVAAAARKFGRPQTNHEEFSRLI